MRIIKLSESSEKEVIEAAVETLSKGGILIYPTETTYGMGVDCENPQAVEKLLSFKEKREGKPLSVAVTDEIMAEKYVVRNEIAKNLYENFLPGPVTVISKSTGITAKGVASEKGTLGIRIPAYELTLEIIRNFGRGITATSANPSGGKRPYKIEDILENISQRQKDLIDLIIDSGELQHNNPSTVIDTVSGEIETVRFGDYRFDLEKKIVTENEAETIDLGEKLALFIMEQNFDKPTVIAIQGDLGTGKTHFAGGIAKGLGINVPVKSPTFILMNEFDFEKGLEKLKFYHIDTYRMEKEDDLLELGFEKMIEKPNIILIEWANRVIPILDKFKDKCEFIWLRFEYLEENSREIYHNLENFND